MNICRFIKGYQSSVKKHFKNRHDVILYAVGLNTAIVKAFHKYYVMTFAFAHYEQNPSIAQKNRVNFT